MTEAENAKARREFDEDFDSMIENTQNTKTYTGLLRRIAVYLIFCRRELVLIRQATFGEAPWKGFEDDSGGSERT